jgi:HEAT repeat protein
MDDPRALDAVAQALDAGTSSLRAAAARALAQVDATVAVPRLLAACGDTDPWVRYYAARSLGHQGDLGAVDALVRLATADPVPPVRIAAVEAISELGSGPGIAALEPLADDADPAVARQVLLALGQSAEPGALAALADALRSRVQGRAIAALDGIGRGAHTSLVPAIATLARSADPELRARAVAVLAVTGGGDAVAALVAAAEEPHQTAGVVDALARLGEEQVPWLARGLGHADVAVRCAVIEALGRMRHGRAAPVLAAALRDEEEAARVAAAHALARIDLRAARVTTGG